MSELQQTIATAAQGATGDATAEFWLAEISAAKRKYTTWHKRGDAIIRRYKDEGSDQASAPPLKAAKRLNLLWSNVETVKPALYSQTPTPNISRRNKDADPVGRTAAMVLERCVKASLGTQVGMMTFDDVMIDIRDDLLLVGQGIAIEEYSAEITETPATPDGAPATQAVANQRCTTRYIHWKDWLTNICRTWAEVWWFGYRAYLTRAEVEKKWGAEIAKAVAYTHKPDESDKSNQANAEQNSQAVIWTIWSLRHRKVFIVAEGFSEKLLDEMPPPVSFEGFWPIPKPVQATVAKDSIIPVPDFVFYQDQADTIDTLTNRIDVLSSALKVRGLYPADMDSLKALIQDGNDMDMVPVENWAMLAERGGASALVVWFPIKDVAAALVSCIEARAQQIENLYQLTGLSDIVRGSTDPGETATAQQIKGQWGSLRIRPRQRSIQRFARDQIALKAEIIAEHFNQATLAEMSGLPLLTQIQKQAITAWQQVTAMRQQQWQQAAAIAQQQGLQPPLPPAPVPLQFPGQPPQGAPTEVQMKSMSEPAWEDVIGLLRDSKLRGFVIDVETDSTVEPDQMAEQKKAVEFIGAMTQFITAAVPVLEKAPQAAPLLGEMLLFGARRFKIGEGLESSIEKFTEQMATAAVNAGQQQQQNPQAEAEQVKAQTEIKKAQLGQQTAVIKASAEQARAQADVAGTLLEHHTTMREKALDAAVAGATAPPVQPNGGMP